MCTTWQLKVTSKSFRTFFLHLEETDIREKTTDVKKSILIWQSEAVLFKALVPDFILSAGFPQGCVLSPLLFIMCTGSCRSVHERTEIIKFVNENRLESDVTKTKELVVDFRKNANSFKPILIRREV